MSSDNNFVVISGWSLIAAAGINHGDAVAIFLLHVAIGKTELPQQFDPADFEPHKVIGVINHAHLVRLRVSHPHAGLTHHWMMVRSSAHSALQRGFRFSRNEEMPS